MQTQGENEYESHDRHRAWIYNVDVDLGDGHDITWWRAFCSALRETGYDDVLSIEHEDVALSPLEGVLRSVTLLREAIY